MVDCSAIYFPLKSTILRVVAQHLSSYLSSACHLAYPSQSPHHPPLVPRRGASSDSVPPKNTKKTQHEGPLFLLRCVRISQSSSSPNRVGRNLRTEQKILRPVSKKCGPCLLAATIPWRQADWGKLSRPRHRPFLLRITSVHPSPYAAPQCTCCEASQNREQQR